MNRTIEWYAVTEFHVVYRSRGKGRTKKRAKLVPKTVWHSRHINTFVSETIKFKRDSF